MSAEKWRPTEVAGTDLAVRVWTHERNVTLEVTETSELGDAFTIGHLTPGQAVRLSRALVAAAAEALGVAV